MKIFSTANGFSPHEELNVPVELKQKLEEILKLMLLIWCKENKALNLITTNPSG